SFANTKQNSAASSRGGRVAGPPVGCQIGHSTPIGPERMRFSSTKDYVATQDLEVAVNAAIVLERPLLVKGEPGTGKTVLAEEVAKAVNAPLLRSEEHTSELQSHLNLVCRLLLEKKKYNK